MFASFNVNVLRETNDFIKVFHNLCIWMCCYLDILSNKVILIYRVTEYFMLTEISN